MDVLLRFFLPLYFALFALVTLWYRVRRFRKRFGSDPLVIPRRDDAYGFAGGLFRLAVIGWALYVAWIAWCPVHARSFWVVGYLKTDIMAIIGVVVMLVALIWTALAQIQMRASWRIGIDVDSETELITHGLFAHSRNPIFLGLIATTLGFFLTMPTAISFVILWTLFVVIQFQIRLEEAHLSDQHGAAYDAYRKRVRRFL